MYKTDEELDAEIEQLRQTINQQEQPSENMIVSEENEQEISENEKLPLLLDDALAQYDDGRMKTALEFLSEYAEKSQIIIFTCHNAISETAQNTGANKISLAN